MARELHAESLSRKKKVRPIEKKRSGGGGGSLIRERKQSGKCGKALKKKKTLGE